MFGFRVGHNPCDCFFPKLLPSFNNHPFESKLGSPLSPAPLSSSRLPCVQANSEMRETKNDLLLDTRTKSIPFRKKHDVDEGFQGGLVSEQRYREFDANRRVWDMYFLISKHRKNPPNISFQELDPLQNSASTHKANQNNRGDFINVIAQHDDNSLLERADSLEHRMPFDMSI